MMRVQTLLFASYRDLTGASSVEVEVPAGATVADLVTALRAQGGRWAELPATPTVAVNRRYARSDARLEPSDEVALIPPVAGG
ncbi:MAG: MoaD/ThiS family protein [Gemmatimonadota bacterium]